LNWLQHLKIIAENTTKEHALELAEEVVKKRNGGGKIGTNDLIEVRKKLGCGPGK
jgi:hypothetical protein